MRFWVKTHYLIKVIFSKYVWDVINNENKVFLTFDDGPTPDITEWTLDLLKKHNAEATFFCIGNNIEKHPKIFHKIIQAGHSVGNHTLSHVNGWKTRSSNYIENTNLCQFIINKHLLQNQNSKPETCNLFRPPYGKIKPSQSKILRKLGFKIIMWDIISFDFDVAVSQKQCLENVLKNVKSGSIIVFHDSVKATQNLKYALPKTLEFFKEKGFVCSKIK